MGFTEAIGFAVVLVGIYLTLNAVVVVVGLWHVVTAPTVVADWAQALTTQHGSPVMMVALALLVFPRLALGLSGFETGVAVMPHIQGGPDDTEERPLGRIHGARTLLTTAAITMSVFRSAPALITTLLIPHAEFEDGGAANGRALAYLAHQYLGSAFGTVYDVSTVAILWFAGASRWQACSTSSRGTCPGTGWPRTGPARCARWSWCSPRTAFLVTWIFDADVNAQGGAYATGVLVLITSAAVAVTIAARRADQRGWTIAFGTIATVFGYTTIANIIERPDGVPHRRCLHRRDPADLPPVPGAARIELRVTDVTLDERAEPFLGESRGGTVRLIANDPTAATRPSTGRSCSSSATTTTSPPTTTRSSSRSYCATRRTRAGDHVRGGLMHGHYRVLTFESATVPDALAALLLHIRDEPGAGRTSTSSGPRATRWRTSSVPAVRPRAGSPRSPGRCCGEAEPDERTPPRAHRLALQPGSAAPLMISGRSCRRQDRRCPTTPGGVGVVADSVRRRPHPAGLPPRPGGPRDRRRARTGSARRGTRSTTPIRSARR